MDLLISKSNSKQNKERNNISLNIFDKNNILHRFIERVRNNKTLHIRGNQLNLIKLTEEQLVKKLKSLFEDRKSVDVSSSESESDNSDSE
jgi:hypothetical protein